MQIHEISLPKKKLITEDRTYLLWESVGRTLVEAQLTPAQIQQVFAQAETGSTAAGSNRTGVGQVKDAGTEVAKAWNDLKSKVQNSGPIKNVDAMYDQAAEKLKQATGGDAGVMRYVEKYRAFAKAHPVAQSLIYSALIAAAGISGVGLGGAAALGLLKMTDKLLQGEKFSTSLGKGLGTAATAYAAGQVGKAFQGGDQTAQAGQQAASGLGRTALSTFQNDPNYGQQLATIIGNKEISPAWMQEFTKQLGQQVANPGDPRSMSRAWILANRIANSIAGNPYSLKESQIRQAFYVAAGITAQLNEGVWDSVKGAASKAAGAVGKYVQTKGHNLTTRVTADKLMSAWKSAGSPTDSEAVADVMRNAGVDEQIITSVLAAVSKTHTGGRVAGQVSQTPNAVRQRQARAANKAPASTAPANTTTPPATGGAGAFGQMAQQVTAPVTPATQTSSTGGTIQKTSTGLTHKANPNNPNIAPPAAKPAGYGNYSAGATNPDGTASSQRQADRYTDNLEYQRKQKANTKSTVKESDKYVKRISESWQEYKLDEGFMGDFAKAGASAVKGAVGGAVQGIKNKAGQIGAQLKDPNAWFSTPAATAAKGGAQLAQQTQKFAQDLAKQWSVEAGNIPKQAAPAEPPATTTSKTHTGGRVAGQVSQTPNAVRQRQARADKKVVPATTAPGAPAPANTMANAPVSKTNIAKPGNPNATPANTMANAPVSKTNIAKPGNPNATPATDTTPVTAPATTKKTSTPRTKIPKPSPAGGGKTITVGKEKIKPTDPRYASLSKAIPNESLQEALNKELARLVAEAVYKAKANNPNQQDQQKYVQGRAGTGAGSDATKFAKYDPATSTTANAAQSIDAMARGGQADRQVATTPPATKLGKVPSTPGANQKQNAPAPVDNNAYIQHFKTWSDGKLATKESNTGIAINMDTVKKQFPEMAQQLDAALKAVAASSADPKANQQAVTSYLSMALKGVQQVAASIRNDPVNKSKMAAGGAAGGSGFADPRVGNDLASKLKLDLGAFKNAMGRQPVRPTNNPQVDGLLKAAGLI